MPLPYTLDEFQALDPQHPGRWAARAQQDPRGNRYFLIEGDWTVDQIPSLGGLYYCTGDVTIAASGTWPQITSVAEGNILITADDVTFEQPYTPGLILYSDSMSDTQAIEVAGSGFTSRNGLLIAPNGKINFGLEDVYVTGGLLAASIKIRSNQLPMEPGILVPVWW